MRLAFMMAAILFVGAAHADEPRTRLSDVDRLTLENTLLKLADIERADKELHQRHDALVAKRDALCRANGIDPAEVGKTVAIDLETGAIQRAPKPKAEPAKK